ncbi:hypothetical protein SAMN05443428_1247 [Caloramator quimbayensis]|uniref:Amidase n=1 Tax=Caloramator quimbayensis TaxID=1147123 RepID=A0A1T4Y5Q5_9CLOT|nr:hypothetical protein [Caloramator quimbayensis]SKA97162.1 hypothetical protein SAMN05443428_1247 [Caloramator quimbayensis]
MKFDKRLLNLSKASLKAYKLLNITVEHINEDAILDAYEIVKENKNFISFGVKNTNAIPRKYISNLLKENKYVWHTIDKMSDGGRAIDIELINPITGKLMTGSSSSTAINVLYGINDVGIGTDGGGSVLGPALSLNLFSVLAKGMGLKAENDNIKKSTDDIFFIPGIGVISHSFDLAINCIMDMLCLTDEQYIINGSVEFLKVAVPEKQNIILPQGIDMVDKLQKTARYLKNIGIDVKSDKFPNFKKRNESIERIDKLLDKYDVLITYEGPVDYRGFGDSVFGVMGDDAFNIQCLSGKYMLKIANMVNATATTIPNQDIASGIVMLTKSGIENGFKLFTLARKILDLYRLPNLYYDYFMYSNMRRKNEFIFSKDRGE